MLRSEWAKAFLNECGFPYSRESILAIIAWCESERAHTLPPTGAKWNPLDTTEPWSGATDYNSVHVRNYQSLADGLAASKATLFNGYYASTVSAFFLRRSADVICDTITRSPWGSHPDTGMVNGVRNHTADYDVPIHGDSAPTPPPNPKPPTPPEPEPPMEDDMPKAITRQDPESGGLWSCRMSDGAIYTDKAPYLGGANNHPDWHLGGQGEIELVDFVVGKDDTGASCYVFIGEASDGLHFYTMPRDGSLAGGS